VNFTKQLLVNGTDFSLKQIDPAYTGKLEKQEAESLLARHLSSLGELQAKLYAQDQYAVLMVLQGMDTSGKDGIIKHVMKGVNPSGVDVRGFKQPTPEELDHDFLWRCQKALPEKGKMGIFNRSHYEEVVLTRVHPEILLPQRLPPGVLQSPNIWQERYEDINSWERHLSRNGTRIIKFFLHISKEKQAKNLLERLDDPAKNWKVARSDYVERRFWDDYQEAYEAALRSTSTEHAPWYVIPSDHKWFARAAVASILANTLSELDPQYPVVSGERRAELEELRQMLENEGV
jgi:PPK2 family polyphosphate:nucleotide phosphotransferase